MNTREIAEEYRLAHWAQIMRARQESGLNIKAFCEESGFHENVYYYWQRKLREAACIELAVKAPETSLTPTGWARLETSPTASAVSVEINGCVVSVTAETDSALLAKVCRTLKTL